VRSQIAGRDCGVLAQSSTSRLWLTVGHSMQRVFGSGNAPLWSREGRATRQAEDCSLSLQNAQAYGLEAMDYQGNEIGQLLNRPPSSGGSDDERWAGFDVRLSAAALRLISDLHYGRVTPEAAGFKLREDRPPFDLAAAFRT